MHSRHIADFNTTLSTKLNRIYSPEISYADKIKHEITPQISYAYVPQITQDNLPSFDGLDRIGRNNSISWSITNDFISKKSYENKKGQKEENYRNFATIKASQSFDLNKYRENDPYPFSNITFDAEINPSKYLSFDADMSWSVYDNEYKSLNTGTTINDTRGDSFRVEYRYTENSLESLFYKIDIKLTQELSVFYSLERNLRDEIDVERQTGWTFKRSCWSFNLICTETAEEDSIAFLITLNGLGEFGKQ